MKVAWDFGELSRAASRPWIETGDAMKLACYALMLIGTAALAGCASDLPELQPSGTVALQGAEPLSLKAPADGQISVYNVSTENLLYSGVIRKGQVVTIDPVAKNVLIDKMVANSKPLYGGDELKILFDANK
jgi:hypothetical protein